MTEKAADDFPEIAKRLAELRKEREDALARMKDDGGDAHEPVGYGYY